MSSPHTPGASGYLLMWGLSILWCAGILGVVAAVSDGDLGALLAVVLLGVPYAAAFSVPVAPPGLLALHLLCRHVPRQWAHVLVATLVGGVAGAGYAVVLDGWTALVPLLAASVGLARWSVVPLVPARRRARSGGPVDDDFAGASPRW